jgi:hypothetical protein
MHYTDGLTCPLLVEQTQTEPVRQCHGSDVHPLVVIERLEAVGFSDEASCQGCTFVHKF